MCKGAKSVKPSWCECLKSIKINSLHSVLGFVSILEKVPNVQIKLLTASLSYLVH